VSSSEDTAREAFKAATIALTKIEEHEKVCDLRYTQIARTLELMQKRWFAVSGAIILLLISILGAIIADNVGQFEDRLNHQVEEHHDKR